VTRVLVTDADRGSAVAIIRSLGRRGIKVTAAAPRGLGCGLYSRFTTERLTYPPPLIDASATVAVLVEAIRARRIDLVIPVTDDVIVPLCRQRDRLASLTKLALPHDQALAAARDKAVTVELAEQLGVPVPRTRSVTTVEQALAESSRLEWPIVLKPSASRRIDGNQVRAFTVSYAYDRASLERQMRLHDPRTPVLLQEFCGGEGHGVGLLMDDGDVVAAFQHRRLREVPLTGGPSSFRESVPLDPELYEFSRRLLGSLGWTGLAMVEYKLGRDGAKLIEINGRAWGSLPLAVRSGVDFPSLLVDVFLADARRGTARPQTTYRVGVRSRDVRLELSWIASVLRRDGIDHPAVSVPRRQAAVAVAVRLGAPGDGYDVLSADDPLPGIAGAIDNATKLARKLRKARGRGR
jgi:predicted ATP-grasp superfamily ATP-dependent carboligase